MTKIVKLHPYMYNLLIDKGLNNFRIADFSDELIKHTDTFTNVTAARTFVYRHFRRLRDTGLIQKIISPGTSKAIYKKTDEFFMVTFTSKAHRSYKSNEKSISTFLSNSTSKSQENSFLNDLTKEKAEHEANLVVILSELDEYKKISQRYPHSKDSIATLYHSAKEQSAVLLGKVTALSKILNTCHAGNEQC